MLEVRGIKVVGVASLGAEAIARPVSCVRTWC